MSSSQQEVIVIGAGVIGTAVAYYLADAGVPVTVLDDKPVGSGCTYHGSGLVWKMIWNATPQYKLAMEARDVLFEIVPQVQEESGVDPMLHFFDTLMPMFNDEDLIPLQRDIETSDGDAEVEWLDREEVLAREPRINPEVQRGAFLEGSAQIDGYELALAYAAAAKRKGAQFWSLKAMGLEKEGGKVTAVRHTGGAIPCKHVVICMGAWSDIASEWLDYPVPVRPLKGETLRVRHPEEFPLKVSRPTGGGATPRRDGLLMTGATGASRFSDRPEGIMKLELDFEPTAAGFEQMIAPSLYVLPCLKEAELVYHLAGPRPLSADGMPIIGPVPGLEGAYVATGHRNKGIHFSALTGRIIRDFIATGSAETINPLNTFLTERFAGMDEIEFTAAGITDEIRRML